MINSIYLRKYVKFELMFKALFLVTLSKKTYFQASPTLATEVHLPIRRLLIQSQQKKHQSNVKNLFKVNNKATRTSLWCLYC